MSHNFPVLYSYRRCPYAMRARMGIYLANQKVEQREIVFWDKPEPMLKASAKGTVPVLILPDGKVLDESRDILYWALTQKGSELTNSYYPIESQTLIDELIDINDDEFKQWLDCYKYADRFPEHDQSYYRAKGEQFFRQLETLLAKHNYLVSDDLSLADIALMPFVRQFANVDKTWFAQSEYVGLQNWLAHLIEQPFFKAVMKNRPVWQSQHAPLWVNEPELQTRDEFVKKAEVL